MPDQSLTTMALDVALPEPQTMQKHLTSANPHPQYVIFDNLAAATKIKVNLKDLADVVVGQNVQLDGKILYHNGATWIPAAVNEIVTEASPTTAGIVRVAKTAEEIRTAIENNNITNLVEQVNPEMYVCCTGYDNGVFSRVIIAEPVGNVADIDGLDTVTYYVYSRGVLSDYVNTDNAMACINIHSGGIAYDTSTCGKVSCYQNAEMKRVNVLMPEAVSNANDIRVAAGVDIWNSMAKLVVAGDVRNVVCSATGHFISTYTTEWDNTERDGYWEKCWIHVVSHGHLRNALIDQDAVLRCETGVIENIIVRYSSVDYPRNYKLVVGPNGSAFNVTLQGNYAYAAVQGYAENVCIYGNCQLDLQYPTAKVKNVTVYNGGRLSLTSGASIEGLVAYPGAIIMKDPTCSITELAQCHEPDKIVKLVTSTSQLFYNEVVSGETVARVSVAYYAGETSWTNLNNSEALCFENAVIKDVVAGETSDRPTYIANPDIMMYSIDTPRGLLRMDTQLIESINKGQVTLESRIEALGSAYQYQDAKVVSCFRATSFGTLDDYGTARFHISTPEGMYADLVSSANTIYWRVVF